MYVRTYVHTHIHTHTYYIMTKDLFCMFVVCTHMYECAKPCVCVCVCVAPYTGVHMHKCGVCVRVCGV
jgi:hypothetical protein